VGILVWIVTFYDHCMCVHIACMSNLGFIEADWQSVPFKDSVRFLTEYLAIAG